MPSVSARKTRMGCGFWVDAQKVSEVRERIVAGHVAARLDRRPGDALRVDDAADRAVGLRERRVDVAGPEVAGDEDVVAPVGLDQRRPRLHRLLGVVDDRQLLVVDLDQVERPARRPLVLRHDRRHGLADVAHPLGTERVPLDALRPHRRRVVGLHDRVHVVDDLLARDHVDDPGHGLGRIRVDRRGCARARTGCGRRPGTASHRAGCRRRTVPLPAASCRLFSAGTLCPMYFIRCTPPGSFAVTRA